MKNVLTDESLLAMAQVKSLKEIHLDRAFVGIGLNEVVQNMNNLERLTLSKTRNNSKKQMDSVLDKLGNLPRLQKVTLIDCPAVTDDGIMSMLYKTTSLIHLKVRLCHAVSAKTLQDIKKIVVVG
ncbi:hypothetical protein BDA99DRAFT_520229 [Phascolomyces articulosus]|uniref:Uncharacterized protein n=1 Tax=Phascolomyces articulosus TaxID=60185 RepID=A0AAD5JT87_9FUNG|nr:hypothetical protein BDA99DRAFT_520229 [Phascolomyces articulosus]